MNPSLSSLSRRTFGASALAAALVPRIARAQTPVTLRLATAPDDDVSAVVYAIDAGLFRKAGLDVQIQAAKSGGAVTAAVVGGSIDLGKSSVVGLITAHNKGIPITLVSTAAFYNADHPIVAMIVAKDSTINEPKDLAGKTLAVPALNDLYFVANAAMVDAAGGAWRDVKYTEIPSSAAPDAVIAHRVDATTLTQPALTAAMETGKVRILGYPFSAIAPRFIQAAWFGTRDFVAKNADAVARFHRVVEAASATVNAKPALSVAPLAAFSKEDPQIIAKMARTIEGGPLDPKFIQPVIDACAKYGGIPAPFPAADLIATGLG